MDRSKQADQIAGSDEGNEITITLSLQQRKATAALIPSHPPESGVSRPYITEVGPNDVLLGRGVPFINNPGNVAFRELVRRRKAEYLSTGLHNVKDAIARGIFDEVHSRNGRFLRSIQSCAEMKALGVPDGVKAWTVADDATAIEKAKQSLRDKNTVKTIPSPASGSWSGSKRSHQAASEHQQTKVCRRDARGEAGAFLHEDSSNMQSFIGSASRSDISFQQTQQSLLNHQFLNQELIVLQKKQQLLVQLLGRQQGNFGTALGIPMPNDSATIAAAIRQSALRNNYRNAMPSLQDILSLSMCELQQNQNCSSGEYFRVNPLITAANNGFSINQAPNPLATQHELFLRSLISSQLMNSQLNADEQFSRYALSTVPTSSVYPIVGAGPVASSNSKLGGRTDDDGKKLGVQCTTRRWPATSDSSPENQNEPLTPKKNKHGP